MKWLVSLVALVVLAGPAAGQTPPPDGRPGSAWLGVTYDLRWIQSGGQCDSRVVLRGVVPGSPAERAGLRSGDAIVAIDGDRVPARRLPLLAARLAPGDSVRLLVERGGSSRAVTAVADRRPDRPPAIALMAPPQPGEGPIIQIRGDSLVATNVPAPGQPRGRQGYWLMAADGRTAFRTLPRRPRSDLDRRVADLMVCVDDIGYSIQAIPPVEMERFQERAESLRVVIAQRLAEHRGNEARAMALRELGSALEEARSQPGDMVLFRGGVSAGVRTVSGADLAVMEPELAEYFRGVRGGLLVLRVAPGTAADRGGLRPGDVVTAAAGRPVGSGADLGTLVAAGDRPLELSIVRQGRARTVTLPRQP